ncbi:MAG: hypothetical protein V1897_16085, partial [Pseudomonadota bacterium]
MSLLAMETPLTDLRQELIDLVEKELLGPAGGPEEEVDENRVRDRYLVGCLAPKDSMTIPEEMDDTAIGLDEMSDDGQSDSKPTERATFLQSSFGFTFIVGNDAPPLRIGAKWGLYTREESVNAKNDKGEPKLVWRRKPIDESWDNFDASSTKLSGYELFRSYFGKVTIQALSKPFGEERIVSIYLVNEQQSPPRSKDQAWLFQPELYVEAMDGSAVFRQRPSSLSSSWQARQPDYEDLVMQM